MDSYLNQELSRASAIILHSLEMIEQKVTDFTTHNNYITELKTDHRIEDGCHRIEDGCPTNDSSSTNRRKND